MLELVILERAGLHGDVLLHFATHGLEGLGARSDAGRAIGGVEVQHEHVLEDAHEHVAIEEATGHAEHAARFQRCPGCQALEVSEGGPRGLDPFHARHDPGPLLRAAPGASQSSARNAGAGTGNGAMLWHVETTIVPCLRDNYAYLVRAPGSREALIVDPGEAAPIRESLERLGLALGAILCTHHHADHVGGNADLVGRYPGIRVVASARDHGRIPAQTEVVNDGDTLDVLGLRFRCLMVPGHTLGAVAYVGHGAVFTGDTLFAAGCGRLFEGTPEMMTRSLDDVLGGLPPETLVYAGHEYTQKNLAFAAHVEPGNRAVTDKAGKVAALRARSEPTLPSTLADERATNPFMRLDAAEIVERYLTTLGPSPSRVAVLAALRTEKDAF